METKAAGYGVKSVGWESAARVAAFVGIVFSAVLFLFMIYRAANLLDLYNQHVDTTSYKFTHSATVLLEVVLWTIMARASIRFKAYTRAISPSKDGEALSYIADAMVLSIVYAIMFDMASTFKTLFIHTPFLGVITTITNLVPLGLFLFLSVLLCIGSYKLTRLVPNDSVVRQRRAQIVSLSLALFTLVVIPYVDYFYRLVPTMLDDDHLHHFVLSPKVLVGLYLIPFVIVWLIGLLSSLHLADYAKRVPGKLYRPMFRNLYLGILIAYFSTYLIQIWYLSNLSAARFGPGLFVLFVLIGMLIAGFTLMYRGANRLYAIEQ